MTHVMRPWLQRATLTILTLHVDGAMGVDQGEAQDVWHITHILES